MVIKLKNIQSYKEVIFTFPDAGLVQIVGGNSNGKSILGKVLKAIATLSFIEQSERESLIQDGTESGYVAIEYKDKVLIVFLHHDRNQCYVTLKRTNGEKVSRMIREGGIDELIEEFGFRIYGKKSVVLQLHETFGIVPFVNTSDAINAQIIESITTDNIAQQFLLNFKEETYKTAKALIERYSDRVAGIKTAKNTLVMYDFLAYEKLYKEIMEIYTIIKNLRVLNIEEIKLPPKVVLIDIPKLHILEIPIPPKVEIMEVSYIVLEEILFVKPIPILNPLEDICVELHKISEIKNGRCPTCGKPLISCKDLGGECNKQD